MKKEMSEIKKVERKAGLTAAALPWWARVLIAQRVEAAFPASVPHHLQHCSGCGCVLISTNMAYRYFSSFCPECSTEKQIQKNQSQGGN